MLEMPRAASLPPICRDGRPTSHVCGSADRSRKLKRFVLRLIPLMASRQSAATKSLPYSWPSHKTAGLLVGMSEGREV